MERPVTTDPPASTCATCDSTCTNGRYCARQRCYCGHPTCWAFASWVEPQTVATTTTNVRKSDARVLRSWDEREGSTWIDQL